MVLLTHGTSEFYKNIIQSRLIDCLVEIIKATLRRVHSNKWKEEFSFSFSSINFSFLSFIDRVI